MTKPVVTYFPFRAVAEAIRLTLAAADVDFENEYLDFTHMEVLKQDLETFSFGQCPRYRDADIDLVQSHAILRYLARKHNLYGSGPLEAARIDQLLDGMGDLKCKVIPLLYADAQQTEEAKAAYLTKHLAAEGAKEKNGGAHMAYVDSFVKKHGKDGFAVGGQLSVADTFLFDLTDLHQTKYGEEFDALYPALAAHHAKIAALLAPYLASPLRHEK